MSVTSRKSSILLWSAQALLAALFLFAGVTKLLMSSAMLEQGPVHLSASFLRFIGVCEIFGAFGLVLPGMFRTHRYLTPLAAAGLVIIMIGATVVTALGGSFLGALIPLVIASLATLVCIGRGGIAVAFEAIVPERTPIHSNA